MNSGGALYQGVGPWNVNRTKKTTVDFGRNTIWSNTSPITGDKVLVVGEYKYLSVHLDMMAQK